MPPQTDDVKPFSAPGAAVVEWVPGAQAVVGRMRTASFHSAASGASAEVAAPFSRGFALGYGIAPLRGFSQVTSEAPRGHSNEGQAPPWRGSSSLPDAERTRQPSAPSHWRTDVILATQNSGALSPRRGCVSVAGWRMSGEWLCRGRAASGGRGAGGHPATGGARRWRYRVGGIPLGGKISFQFG